MVLTNGSRLLGHLHSLHTVKHRLCIRELQIYIKRFRAMSSGRQDDPSSSKSDHLQRTADNSREQLVSSATVENIVDISPTVKALKMFVHEKNFVFKAGQWVDFFIPDMNKVGGFSMTSIPNQLRNNKTMDFAIKYSKHPPAHWVHTQCKGGAQVSMRVGGDFFYDPQPGDVASDVLLIGGGVGINPIFSIMQHASELMLAESDSVKAVAPKQLTLLYSAGSVEELIFKDDVIDLCQRNKEMSCQFHVTKERLSAGVHHIHNGRINESVINNTLDSFESDISALKCYICGPSSMIADMESLLLKRGVKHIYYEKWW